MLHFGGGAVTGTEVGINYFYYYYYYLSFFFSFTIFRVIRGAVQFEVGYFLDGAPVYHRPYTEPDSHSCSNTGSQTHLSVFEVILSCYLGPSLMFVGSSRNQKQESRQKYSKRSSFISKTAGQRHRD